MRICRIRNRERRFWEICAKKRRKKENGAEDIKCREAPISLLVRYAKRRKEVKRNEEGNCSIGGHDSGGNYIVQGSPGIPLSFPRSGSSHTIFS